MFSVDVKPKSETNDEPKMKKYRIQIHLLCDDLFWPKELHASKSVYAGILISSNIYGCFWSQGQSESR